MTKRRRPGWLAFFSVGLAGLAPMAHAEDWRLAANGLNDAGGDAISLIDASSIRRIGQRVRFRTYTVYARIIDGYDNVRIMAEADCETYAYRRRQSTTYLANRKIGTFHHIQWETARAGTAGRRLIDRACGTTPLDPLPHPDPYDFARAILAHR